MPKLTMPKRTYAVGAVAMAAGALAIGLFLYNRQAHAEAPLSQPPGAEAWKAFHYEASGRCSDCHSAPTGPRVTSSGDFILLTEQAIWRTFDKHAQAYAVLEGKRGQMISKLLYGESNKDKVLKAEGGCLSCHAMHNLSEQNVAAGQKALDKEDGVSCTGCHGPSLTQAGGWFGTHQQIPAWRDRSPQKKYEEGMRNLRDPVVRAELCMSCHIGNAREGKVVTHAMMAAGHPPLPPIEIATFSKNEPQHWRDMKDVPYFNNPPADKAEKIKEHYDLKHKEFAQTRAALLGSVVAVRETLKLAHDRANFDATLSKPMEKWWLWPELQTPSGPAEPKNRWPELAMAHTDCYACHHDLKYPGYRQDRGFGYFVPGQASARVTPGRPVIRTWPLASLSPALLAAGRKDVTDLSGALRKLAEVTSARPFGAPSGVQTATADVVKWCDGLIQQLSKVEFDKEKVQELVKKLVTAYGNESKDSVPDFETARQIGSIIRVATMELKSGENVDKKVATLTEMLNLEPYSTREKRLDIMRDVIWAALPNENKPARAAYDTGFDGFKEHLKMLKEGKVTQQDLRKLVGNTYLTQLSVSLENKQFTKALLSQADKLQALSDKEEKQVLETIANYDPQKFIATLKEIGKLMK